jgi:hypothetical protein
VVIITPSHRLSSPDDLLVAVLPEEASKMTAADLDVPDAEIADSKNPDSVVVHDTGYSDTLAVDPADVLATQQEAHTSIHSDSYCYSGYLVVSASDSHHHPIPNLAMIDFQHD